MNTRILCGVVLASLLGACAVDSALDTDEVTQNSVLLCDGTRIWTVYYRQNGVEVGRENCDCGSTVVLQQGILQGTRQQVLGPWCPFEPNPGPPPGCLTNPGAGTQSVPPIGC